MVVMLPSTPTPTSSHPFPSLRPVQLLTALWCALTAVNVSVWAMMAVINLHVDRPWFLWASVPLGLVVLGARWFETRRAR